MRRAALLLPLAVVLAAVRPDAQQAPPSELDLVGTWTLAAMQQGVDSDKPANVQNPRGLLVFDAAGHVIEVLARAAMPPPAEPQARFRAFGGAWGGYRADLRENRITYRPVGAVSPNVMGTEFSRSIELAGDVLTITSLPGELHAQGVTRWRWERVPAVENLSAGYRQVIGFWEHVVEKRVNLTTGVTTSESARAPSVIVYTPSGYVGVHFPPLNRPRFASGEPTDAEARAALMGYVGYFGALAVYPGMVFHHIMAGLSPAAGNTLKRFYDLQGRDLNIRFPPTTNPQGQQQATLVTLRRLSGATEMLPPPRR